MLRDDKKKRKLLNSVFTTTNKIHDALENCEEQIEGQDQILWWENHNNSVDRKYTLDQRCSGMAQVLGRTGYKDSTILIRCKYINGHKCRLLKKDLTKTEPEQCSAFQV